jgi:hypothetical protein
MTVVDSEDAVVHLQEPEARHLAHPLGLASTLKLAMSEPPVAVGAASMTIAEVRVTVTKRMAGLENSRSSCGAATVPHTLPGLHDLERGTV